MKNLHTIILLVLFTISCSNDKATVLAIQPAINTATISNIKTLTMGTAVFTLFYDSIGRVIMRSSNNGSNDEYSYTANQVTHTYLYNNVLQKIIVYYLNSDGLKIKSLVTFPTAGNYQTIYTYNNSKQLQTMVNSNDLNTKTSTTTFFYSGKNLAYYEETFSYNTNKWVKSFTYFLDKVNTFGNKNQGNFFDNQEQSENVLKTFTAVFSASNSVVETYSYQYDDLNRVIKKFQDNVLINVIEYN